MSLQGLVAGFCQEILLGQISSPAFAILQVPGAVNKQLQYIQETSETHSGNSQKHDNELFLAQNRMSH